MNSSKRLPNCEKKLQMHKDVNNASSMKKLNDIQGVSKKTEQI